MSKRIDIGSGHQMQYFGWDPDLSINPQYEHIKHLLPVKKAGVNVYHKKPDGSDCMSGIMFDLEGLRDVFREQNVWQVQSWDPLTISPSLLCLAPNCGDHGFIREGRWVPA